GNVVVSARPITVTAQANTKTYDGTISSATAPTITSGSLAAGDTATLTETYDTRNAGTGKTLAPTVAITNSSNVDVTANYVITLVNNTSGVINPKALTVSGITAASAIYDGTTTAKLGGTAAFQATEAVGAGTTADGKPYSVDTV